jgi:hypothetical protein
VFFSVTLMLFFLLLLCLPNDVFVQVIKIAYLANSNWKRKSDISTTVTMKVSVFWDLVLCYLIPPDETSDLVSR